MTRAGRAEAAVQVALMVGVGGVAGAASWAHVVALAVAHGQPGWLAVADAAVVETTAVSAGLEVRRRRRAGYPAGSVVAVLVAAVALSLAAQVAQAQRSPWGWVLAAVPAAGFLVLVKLALSARAVPAGPDRDGTLPAVPAPSRAEDGPVPTWSRRQDQPVAALEEPEPPAAIGETAAVPPVSPDETDETPGGTSGTAPSQRLALVSPDPDGGVSPAAARYRQVPPSWPAPCPCGCNRTVSRSTYWRHTAAGRMQRPDGGRSAP